MNTEPETPCVGGEEVPESPEQLKDRLREELGESHEKVHRNSPQGEIVEESYMGDRKRVVWFPDSIGKPNGITVDEYVASQAWRMGKGKYKEHSDGREQLRTVYSIDYDSTHHVVGGEFAEAIATAVGIDVTQLLDSAKIRPEKEVFPVLFDEQIPFGQILLTPISEVSEVPDVDMMRSSADTMNFR